jgi:hypothetical protein
MVLAHTPDNPFPIDSVATYGATLRTCESLAYMQACREQLNEYLIKYEKSDTRYGCSIGLRGGHGSGKTHLLSWLGKEAAARSVSKPVVLYAKADRPSFFDLYTQILAQVKRADLQLIIAEAVKNLAVEEVNKAEATRSIEKRLQTPAELQRLFHEENLDREALFFGLRERLQVSGAPQEITQALLLVESPTLGEKALTWLSGKRIDDYESLGISYQLDALPVVGETTSIPDVVAVNALETLAALFAVARRPLLILVDQLEILLRTDAVRQVVLSSIIKKLIEQLSRQSVLMFMAGTPEPWSVLPRDVAPRLRTREPLPIGDLSAKEARLLLEAFSAGEFSHDALPELMRITGGNPREILRIAHHVFSRVSGTLENASPEDIIECAQLAGTLDDKRKLVLADADQAFAGMGVALSDVDVGGDVPVDRLLQTPSAPAIALIVLTAADRVSEAKLAKGLLSTTRKLNERWQDVRVVVVSIGYSTESIREQLGRTANVFEYAEGSFSRALQGVLAEAIRIGGARSNTAEAVSSADFQDLFAKIETRLSSIEARRVQETQKILENFIAKTHVSSESERERKALKTRWDVLAELENLANASENDSSTQRESMRAVLVANEANIKNGRLDFLGSMYLDCLTSAYYKNTTKLRAALLLEMRRVLRPATASNQVFDHPWRTLAMCAGAVAVFLVLAIVLPLMFPVAFDIRRFVQWSVLTAVVALLYVGFGIVYWPFSWRSRWNGRFKEATQLGS